jgi:hypothetical protein
MMRLLTVTFMLFLLPLTAAAQAVTFEREGVEYRLELPFLTMREPTGESLFPRATREVGTSAHHFLISHHDG